MHICIIHCTVATPTIDHTTISLSMPFNTFLPLPPSLGTSYIHTEQHMLFSPKAKKLFVAYSSYLKALYICSFLIPSIEGEWRMKSVDHNHLLPSFHCIFLRLLIYGWTAILQQGGCVVISQRNEDQNSIPATSSSHIFKWFVNLDFSQIPPFVFSNSLHLLFPSSGVSVLLSTQRNFFLSIGWAQWWRQSKKFCPCWSRCQFSFHTVWSWAVSKKSSWEVNNNNNNNNKKC